MLGGSADDRSGSGRKRRDAGENRRVASVEHRGLHSSVRLARHAEVQPTRDRTGDHLDRFRADEKARGDDLVRKTLGDQE